MATRGECGETTEGGERHERDVGGIEWGGARGRPLAVEMQGHFVSWDSLSAAARATYRLKQCIMRDHRQDAI